MRCKLRYPVFNAAIAAVLTIDRSGSCKMREITIKEGTDLYSYSYRTRQGHTLVQVEIEKKKESQHVRGQGANCAGGLQ